jgi:hypothetical protein
MLCLEAVGQQGRLAGNSVVRLRLPQIYYYTLVHVPMRLHFNYKTAQADLHHAHISVRSYDQSTK